MPYGYQSQIKRIILAPYLPSSTVRCIPQKLVEFHEVRPRRRLTILVAVEHAFTSRRRCNRWVRARAFVVILTCSLCNRTKTLRTGRSPPYGRHRVDLFIYVPNFHYSALFQRLLKTAILVKFSLAHSLEVLFSANAESY
jgi:hypothetical protein